jgi:hypothetical protein
MQFEQHRAISIFQFQVQVLGDFNFSVSGLTGLTSHYHPCCILGFQFHPKQHDHPPHQHPCCIFTNPKQLARFMLVKNVGTVLA